MQEQKLNSEQKDEAQLPSSPNNGNTHVIGSQSTSYNLEDVEKAKDFIWNYMSDLDKLKMIKMSSHTFIESPELKLCITAVMSKEGIATC